VGDILFHVPLVQACHEVRRKPTQSLQGTLFGAPETPFSGSAFALLFGRKSLSGSLIGGIRETQEMLDFCGEHNITADVEVIPIQQVNEAYERLARSEVKYHFSIETNLHSQAHY